ncbi:MAG: serine hydrolase [Candidatus Eremiobacteraeota bacterium]|nr:serine hydrolase [Candidatus Eremiobacteraeota bacterium]MCW5868467.1 serine hydrolase [Candidatus Eremiobacteraeota bacterium]
MSKIAHPSNGKTRSPIHKRARIGLSYPFVQATLCLILLLAAALAWRFWPRSRLRAGSEELIENLIERAITEHKLPGAVVLVGHRGRIVYRRAFGQRALEPAREAMTVDTIFDLSSLTKVLATATSIMLLSERGQLLLSDPLGKFVPHLQDPLARSITLEQLLTHTSGYPAQLDLSKPWQGREGAYEELQKQILLDQPGSRYRYSDINYIALGFVVEKVAEQDLASFTHDQLWVPLGVAETTRFCPPESLTPIAPTEWRDGKMLRGGVHGLQAARMGGIAGNGGLFSRADDLARYCQMILDGGRWHGRQILGSNTLARMVRPVVVSETGASRGLGWDLDSRLAVSRGDFFPRGSFGHTGYAGSSIWIDPGSQTYVIFLSNMVHPRGQGDVRELRARLFSLVAASLEDADPQAWSRGEEEYAARLQVGLQLFRNQRAALNSQPGLDSPPVQNGLEVLGERNFAELRGKRNGLLGPPSTLKRLRAAGLEVVALQSPPTTPQLEQVQQLVIDLAAPGTRFDPQLVELRNWLLVAAPIRLPVLLLDHPCWLGGEHLEGPVANGRPGRAPDAVWMPMLPTQPAMTLGELAGWLNQESQLGVRLQVVPARGWKRSARLEEIGQVLESTVSGLDNLTTLLLYPALGPLEETNLSVGRGTERPYGWVGAPWIDSLQLAGMLNHQGVPGMRFAAHQRRPRSHAFAGQVCGGVDLLLVDRSQVHSQRVGLEIGCALRRLYPQQWRWSDWSSSFQESATIRALQRSPRPPEIEAAWQPALAEFRKRRQPYLLYK